MYAVLAKCVDFAAVNAYSAKAIALLRAQNERNKPSKDHLKAYGNPAPPLYY